MSCITLSLNHNKRMLSFSKYWQPYWQVVSIIRFVCCVIPIDIKPWLRTWSCLGKLRKLSMTKDRGVCWDRGYWPLGRRRPGPGPGGGHWDRPGPRKTNTDRAGESGHDITILPDPRSGPEYFDGVSCHSHSPAPVLTDGMTQDQVPPDPGYSSLRLKTVPVTWAWFSPPSRVTLQTRDECSPGPLWHLRPVWGMMPPCEEHPLGYSSVCLVGSWLCLDNVNVSCILCVRLLFDEWLGILFCSWWREWRQIFKWYTQN